MDLRKLEYFVAVAEELHFGKAAARLHIAQPPLSRHIMRLEEELGVKLFERTPKGLKITPAGLYLKIEAAKILNQTNYLRTQLRAFHGKSTCRVKIGYVGSVMHSFLPELLREFQGSVPNLTFELVELGSREQAKALSDGTIDLGFVRSWLSLPGVRFVPLVEETLSVVFSREFSKDEEGRGAFDRIKALPFIAMAKTSAPGLVERIQGIFEEIGFVPSTTYTVGQYDTVLRLTAAGLGWALVPTLAVRNSGFDLNSVELDGPNDRVVVGVAVRDGNADPLLEELVSISTRYFSPRSIHKV